MCNCLHEEDVVLGIALSEQHSARLMAHRETIVLDCMATQGGPFYDVKFADAEKSEAPVPSQPSPPTPAPKPPTPAPKPPTDTGPVPSEPAMSGDEARTAVLTSLAHGVFFDAACDRQRGSLLSHPAV